MLQAGIVEGWPGLAKGRVLVLGIDCLDYGLVSRWRLHGYRVGVTGYHYVGLDLYTPVIWAKMLTGLDVTRYGFSSQSLSRRKRLRSLYYLAYTASLIRNVLPAAPKAAEDAAGDGGGLLRAALDRLASTGFKGYQGLGLRERLAVKLLAAASRAERLPRRLRERSVVAYAERLGLRVRLVEFPPWNDEVYSLVRNMLYFYVSADEKGRARFLDLVWGVTSATLSRVPRLLRHYDVVFWYTPYIDVASHLYYRPRCPRCMLRLRAAYKRLERLVSATLPRLPGGTEVLIVSDHGYNPRVQDHSHYGYWSSTSAPVKPARAEEVADLIKALIRGAAGKR